MVVNLDTLILGVANNVAKNNVGERGCENREEEEEEEKPSNVSKSVSAVVTSNAGSYPPKNRYQDVDLDLEGSDLNDDVKVSIQEESSESLFSLSFDSIEQVHGAGLGDKELTSPMPKCGSPPMEETKKVSGFDRNARVRSQLDVFDRNPVENLTQLMIVAKGRAA
ncbi:hypothetical protein NC652_040732 [Populus alba x Populus x berolinensis]|nr:hypothetical protein NC652_040732 [Populus alba x Populus x berolinensis]